MKYNSQDQINILPDQVQFNEIGAVNLNDMNMLIYFQFKSTNP